LLALKIIELVESRDAIVESSMIKVSKELNEGTKKVVFLSLSTPSYSDNSGCIFEDSSYFTVAIELGADETKHREPRRVKIEIIPQENLMWIIEKSIVCRFCCFLRIEIEKSNFTIVSFRMVKVLLKEGQQLSR